MKKLQISSLATLLCGMLALPLAQAGSVGMASKETEEIQEPERVAPGSITIGGRFSNHLTDGYLDLLLPVWATPTNMLGISSRITINDRDQDVYSFGAVWRTRLPDHDVILGLNGFYDYIESQEGNHFDQLGLGAEVLTHYVDARFNWYLPDDSSYILDHGTSRSSKTSRRTFARNGTLTRETTTVTSFTETRRLECGLQGFYTEAGVLVPGLDNYFELRLFAGYYHYNNPFGRDFKGFEARAEARLLPGLIADIAYYDDQYFMGGHWVAGVRAEVPFDFGNLFRGRNPFEGAAEAFTPGHRREFRDRMGEMVIRSPRVKTIVSQEQKETTTSTSQQVMVSHPVVPKPSPSPTAQPSVFPE